MKKQLIFSGLLCVLAMTVLFGCDSGAPRQSPVAAVHSAAPSRPYVLHLNGIGGFMWIDRELIAGLEQANLDADIDHYDWTANDPGLGALFAYERNQKQADIV